MRLLMAICIFAEFLISVVWEEIKEVTSFFSFQAVGFIGVVGVFLLVAFAFEEVLMRGYILGRLLVYQYE